MDQLFDLWGKKTEVTGSYFYNNNKNTSEEKINREFFLSGDSSQLYDENSISSSKNNNHRVNLRIENKIDSSNTLLITPNISFQNNDGFSEVSGANSFKAGSNASSLLAATAGAHQAIILAMAFYTGMLLKNGAGAFQ